MAGRWQTSVLTGGKLQRWRVANFSAEWLQTSAADRWQNFSGWPVAKILRLTGGKISVADQWQNFSGWPVAKLQWPTSGKTSVADQWQKFSGWPVAKLQWPTSGKTSVADQWQKFSGRPVAKLLWLTSGMSAFSYVSWTLNMLSASEVVFTIRLSHCYHGYWAWNVCLNIKIYKMFGPKLNKLNKYQWSCASR